MKLPILISVSLLLLAAPTSRAQSADDYFHGGALHYLSNNIPAALQTVTNGLSRFPDDAKLQKLHELLNQQQEQQQQQQEQKDEQPQPDQQPAKDDQQKADDQENQQSKPQADDKPAPGKPEDKPETGEPQSAAPKQMTPEEAQRLLDAQKGEEKVLTFQPQGEPKNRRRMLKDW